MFALLLVRALAVVVFGRLAPASRPWTGKLDSVMFALLLVRAGYLKFKSLGDLLPPTVLWRLVCIHAVTACLLFGVSNR